MPISPSTIAQAAGAFGAKTETLAPLSGGHVTSVYEFARGTARYVLRIIPPSADTPPDAVRAIQGWMAYLADRDGPVPAPLAARDGRFVVEIDQEGRHYTAVATEKAPGILAETLTQDQWTDDFFHAIGRAAGQLHALALAYRPAPVLRRPEMLSLGDLFGPDQDVPPTIKARKLAVLEIIDALPRSPKQFTMVHGDFHFGNFFVDPDNGHAITVFDFDDCGYCWPIMDTATQVFDVLVLYNGPDREAFARHFLTCYLRGYQTEHAVDPFWLAQLPHFLKLLEISYYALLAPTSSPDDDDFWVSAFLPRRRERIEAGVPYVELDLTQPLADLA